MAGKPWLIPAFFTLAFLFSCNSAENTREANQSKPFFDLEGYFEEQISMLSNTQPALIKKVTIGEKTEEREVENIDFEEELQIFRKSDINRPNWLDKYQADSIRQGSELAAIRYTALDTTLNTRSLQVYFQQGEVDSIRILNQTSSLVADTRQDLFYHPQHAYRISSTQKTIGKAPREILITVQWKMAGTGR